MARLYPPIINGTIPAFCGTTLVVPFSLNRAVAKAEIYGFSLKIKTINGNLKETILADSFDIDSFFTATFSLMAGLYTIGQYYKVQIAFINKDGDVGYYSDIGIVKYTTKPKVTIEGLVFGSINTHKYTYTGVYSQEGQDITEKLYSSRFIVYDTNENIIEDSGEILHNITQDTENYEAIESFNFKQDISWNASYYIRFIATTTNGLEVMSPKYRIIQKQSVSPDTDLKLKAVLNQENGFIHLSMQTSKKMLTGTFLITRMNSLTPSIWEEIQRFDLQAVDPQDWSLIDCTIEHGAYYTYAIQQYNENDVYSERIESNIVQADFEDSFLFDGTKQLRIRFNPQMSSFKTDVLEQKTDTIGSKHPFITRNGNVSYKEFPIGGLISYWMDKDEQMFMTLEEIGVKQLSTNLTSENIYAERTFKMAVLDWLNNGETKLFRSPTEGNFIVRLMNVSLSPNNSLGRMLHSFSATAYEIADFNQRNLEIYHLIDPVENLVARTRWASVNLTDYADEYYGKPATKIQLNHIQRPAYKVSFVGMMPGSLIYLDNEEIMIGATGAYSAENPNAFFKVCVDSRFLQQGVLTYEYKSKAVTAFNTILKIDAEDIPVKQFIGNDYVTDKNNNLLQAIQDIKHETTHIALCRFEKRNVEDIYVLPNEETKQFEPYQLQHYFFADMDCKIPKRDFDIFTLYRIRLKRDDYRGYPGEGIYIDQNSTVFAPYTNYCYDGYTQDIFLEDDSLFTITIDDETIDLSSTGKYSLSIPNSVKTIITSRGIISEIGYSQQVITYTFETSNERVAKAKMNYQKTLNQYHDFISDENMLEARIEQKRKEVKITYDTFLKELSNAITEYKEVYG